LLVVLCCDSLHPGLPAFCCCHSLPACLPAHAALRCLSSPLCASFPAFFACACTAARTPPLSCGCCCCHRPAATATAAAGPRCVHPAAAAAPLPPLPKLPTYRRLPVYPPSALPPHLVYSKLLPNPNMTM
jgi:hypothetical protein